MKAHYRAFNGRLVIEVEGTTIKDIIKEIGPIAEVLDGDDCCGKCGDVHIYPRCREATKADGKTVYYYELVCSVCGAKLSFGQHSEGGTLWAKRNDEQGNPLDYRGWKVYRGLPPASSNPQASAPKQPPATSVETAAVDQRPEPDELKLMLDRMRMNDDSALKEACEFLKADLTTLDATWGAYEYKRITEACRAKYPRPATIPKEAVRTMLLDLWDSLTKLRAKAPPAGNAVAIDVIDDDDVPF